MARYENLPIYKKAMELLVYIEQTVRNFPRYHKYALGSRLRDRCFEITLLIVKINNTVERKARISMLRLLRDTAEEIKIALTAAKELKAFSSFKSYNHAARMAVDICRQSEGWLGAVARKPPPESYPRRSEARP